MRTAAFVSVASGTGKTTLATHVAAAAIRAGVPDVAVVVACDGSDSAPPAAAGAVKTIPTAHGALESTLARLREEGARYAFVDVASTEPERIQQAAEDVELVVIPVLAPDREAEEPDATVSAVAELGSRFLFVANRVGPEGLSADTTMAMTQHGQVCPVLVPDIVGLGPDSATAGTSDVGAAGEVADLTGRLWSFLADQLERYIPTEPTAEPQAAPNTSRPGRREHPRWPVKSKVTLHKQDETGIGRLQNISVGGAMVLTQMPLTVGDAIRIDVPDAGVFAARVVHHVGDLYGCVFVLGERERAGWEQRLDQFVCQRTGLQTAATRPAAAAREEPAPPDAPAEPQSSRYVLVDRQDLDREQHVMLTERRADTTSCRKADAPRGRATMITVANPKGGSGKSTIATHLIVALLRAGYRVASADLDPGQWTLTRYLENRRAYKQAEDIDLPEPVRHSVFETDLDEDALTELRYLKDIADYVVIDTAGRLSNLAMVAHALADVVITPINDSFVDLDVLAKVDPHTLELVSASHYGDFVSQARRKKAESGLGSIDWIVLRNRLTNLDARNKRDMADAVSGLADRLGFRSGPGLGERTIYRQLFLHGLTLSDMRDAATPLSMSHVAARQELRSLLHCLDLPARDNRMSDLASIA